MPKTHYITLAAEVRHNAKMQLVRIREFYTIDKRNLIVALTATILTTAMGYLVGLIGPNLGAVVGLLLGIAGVIWLPASKTPNREIEHISTY